jgi:hypothetical protein
MSEKSDHHVADATPLAHGIPEAACDAEPTGLPTSDRHYTETSAAGKGGSENAEKHRHTA